MRFALRAFLATSTATALVCLSPPTLLVFGSNNSGQLGLGDQANRHVPESGANFIAISAKKSVSAGITPEGAILTWGKSKNGALGHELQRNLNITLPQKIHCPEQVRFRQVSCGYSHMAAVSEEGQVFVWGSGKHLAGSSGGNQQKEYSMREKGYIQLNSFGLRPTKVTLPQKVEAVACGSDHTFALGQSGKVYSWGGSQALGRDGPPESPLPIPVLAGVVRIATGPDFAFAVTKSGQCYGWGNNNFSQLGLVQSYIVKQPRAIGLTNIKQVSCGDKFAVAVNDEGEVYSWGSGGEGQLGHGNKSDVLTPKKLSLPFKTKKVSCGSFHTAFICEGGGLYLTGRGREGQLGIIKKDESSLGRMSPVQVQLGGKASEVACGGQHTLVLM